MRMIISGIFWGGKDSPLFDKSKMATFERAFIEEAETHKEEKGAYYTLREQEEICDKILDEFGGDRYASAYHQRTCPCPFQSR